jgi:hypothetical protein
MSPLSVAGILVSSHTTLSEILKFHSVYERKDFLVKWMQNGPTWSSDYPGGYLTSTFKHAFLTQISLQNKQLQGSQPLNGFVFQPLQCVSHSDTVTFNVLSNILFGAMFLSIKCFPTQIHIISSDTSQNFGEIHHKKERYEQLPIRYEIRHKKCTFYKLIF